MSRACLGNVIVFSIKGGEKRGRVLLPGYGVTRASGFPLPGVKRNASKHWRTIQLTCGDPGNNPGDSGLATAKSIHACTSCTKRKSDRKSGCSSIYYRLSTIDYRLSTSKYRSGAPVQRFDDRDDRLVHSFDVRFLSTKHQRVHAHHRHCRDRHLAVASLQKRVFL